ncbi:U1 small nuclear ribonucleoprotein C-2-like [Miscanthus floridulus]|uniref:U1 small nuclear ribonucleoprotein C-2-like n=1 Tax=Miscanthus floridulus TaxID=154761 RepID=UPI0034585F11
MANQILLASGGARPGFWPALPPSPGSPAPAPRRTRAPRSRPGGPAPAPRVPGRRPELTGAPGSELPGDSDPAGPELPRRPRAPPAPPCPAAGQQREKERTKRKKEKGRRKRKKEKGRRKKRKVPTRPPVDPRAVPTAC